MSKAQTLQDPFLNALRKEHIPVSIYLVNGIKLMGVVDSFDQFVVCLKGPTVQMIYKHAISTVVPTRNISVTAQEEDGPAQSDSPSPAVKTEPVVTLGSDTNARPRPRFQPLTRKRINMAN